MEKHLPHNHGTHSLEIMNNLPSSNEVESVAETLKQLGDPSRLRIFWLLCHCEECVINIAALMDMTSPAVSHHLRLLKSANLITATRRGKEMYYKTKDTVVAQTLHHMIEDLVEITCPDKK